MSNNGIIRIQPGLSSRGTIQRVISSTEVEVSLDTSPQTVTATYYPAYYGTDGHFIGGVPQPGTPVVIQQGQAARYYIIAILPGIGKTPEIDGNSLLIQSDSKNILNLNPDEGITLGSKLKNIRIDSTDVTRSIFGTNFDSNFTSSEAAITIDGIVKREPAAPSSLFDSISRRESVQFDQELREVAMDPSMPSAISHQHNPRNPPFVERRELVYEFAHSYGFQNDQEEYKHYIDKKVTIPNYLYNRREARSDVLSLSLVAPNYLMETIKGTVVDIYGNVLDINRSVLPAGKEKQASFIENDKKENTFQKLREIERKSIAYHFEINARKSDYNSQNNIAIAPDVNSLENFSRYRSRFSLDIDKEGLFKLNVPASSEKGNVPLLVRAENASTIEAAQNGTDPNEFSFNNLAPENANQRRDIFLDSFAYNGGSISIADPDNDSGYSVPNDRLRDNAKIMHGTVYHDVLDSLAAFRGDILYEYDPKATLISTITFPSTFVSDTINVSGDKPNAGGRSGSMNFDGMIELNIGANSVDKQSLWIDTQGGMMATFGRDFNNVSAGISLTGDLLIQVGGCDVGSVVPGATPISDTTCKTTDPRFKGKNLAFRPGAVDIRVYRQNGEPTVFRIDNFGVTVLTSGNMSLVAGQDLVLKGQNVSIVGEVISTYTDDEDSVRVINRSGQSI